MKQWCCPHCGASGTLNRHGPLSGKGFGTGCARVRRGHRVFCSNRARRRGCGRTFSIFLGAVLPRHGVPARLLSGVIEALLSGASVKAAVESLRTVPVLETLYHLLKRLRLRSDALRVLLLRQTGPPVCAFKDSFLQTLAHLRAAFLATAPATAPGGGGVCMCAWFQLCFQASLLG